MHRACLSRLVFDACKYLFAGNANIQGKRGREGAKRYDDVDDGGVAQQRGGDDDGGYTLNCSAEIDGVSPLPLERFVCPTYTTRARICIWAPMCGCMFLHVYVYLYMCNGAKEGVARWWRHRICRKPRQTYFLNVIQDCINFHLV